jgi:lipopolysaccharide/colanic/teichoic acid biosynthesis glycosyltransferase
LPQFWNVLKGDMSLVGPRPLPTSESQACEGWHRRRLNITPGITCTWQVSGRGKVRFDDWVRMDLRYMSNQSLLADMKLVFVTVPSLVFQRGMR